MRGVTLTALLFALAALAARGDDADPEPPGGAEARKLRGTWKVTRMSFRGQDIQTANQATYRFKGDKVEVDTGRLKYTAKLKFDTKKKPFSFEMTREDAKLTPRSMMFKFEKDELFLAQAPQGGPKPDDIFGATAPLLVLKKEKE